MKNALLLVALLVAFGMLWALPLYLCTNFVLWLFHLSFRLTLLQSFGVCVLLSVIKGLFFNDKGGN